MELYHYLKANPLLSIPIILQIKNNYLSLSIV